MKNSAIQWCDHTYNPWLGCRKVAPECENCYIVETTPLRVRGIKHGSQRVRTSEAYRKQPLRWNVNAELEFALGIRREPPRVFCLSLGDWLDSEVPIEWFAELLVMIHDTPNLDWLLLTKRPQNFLGRMRMVRRHGDGFVSTGVAECWIENRPPRNVWIGVSAGADQREALDIPAKIHFLSCEPMLKPLDTKFLPTQEFDWIIFGGESGKNARPCRTDWIRDGVKFCERNDIACFVKQLGANAIGYNGSAKYELKDSHGGDMEEWSPDLRVREFPLPK
jgi:protein gp37